MTDPRSDRARRDRARPGEGVWVVLPTYNEADNIEPIVGGHPRGAAGGDPARRRRRVARRHRAAGRRARRGRPAHPGPPSAGSSRVSDAPISTASGWRSPAAPTTVVQMDADFSHDPAVAARRSIAADHRRRGRPRHRVALHQGRRRRRLGDRPADRLARRQPVRADRAGPRPERPDRRLQGMARRHARGGPVRRRPRRRLRLPDRDDLPRRSRRGPHPRDPDHVPRPSRRPVEDEPPDRRRGARGRRPAAGRGAARPRTATPAIAEHRPGRDRHAGDGRARVAARAGRRRPASASSSMPGRSRPPTARRSPRPISTGCSARSTRSRSPASRSRS